MTAEKNWWLAAAPGWGAVKLRQLTECMGDGRQVLETMAVCESPEKYFQWIGTVWEQSHEGQSGGKLRVGLKDVKRLWDHRTSLPAKKEEYRRWQEAGIRFVTLLEQDYPQKLRQIYDPPFALYIRGKLPDEDRKSAAVIGARACTGYGIQQGRRIARELATQGIQIISGLAYGIDSEGHWGALESGVKGATYAILGCGVDLCYPPEHEKLARRILENGGGLISEFPMGTIPRPKHFPMRNRIISGLSDCILVIEARKRSGSLITVDQALEQGREIFALPGRVGDSLSEGCLHLIRNGANVLLGSGDVMEYLYPYKKESGDNELDQPKNSPLYVSGKKNAVYSCLDYIGKTVEDIMEITGLSLSEVRMELLELLLEGQIKETGKGYYSVEL